MKRFTRKKSSALVWHISEIIKCFVSCEIWLLQLQGLTWKKENKNGTMSPDSPEPDDSYTLTPRTEAKYKSIDEDFQMMMQRNQQMSSGRMGSSASNYSLPVSVPVGTYNDSNLLQASPQMAHQNISPRPSSSETDGKMQIFHLSCSFIETFTCNCSLSIRWYAWNVKWLSRITYGFLT